MEKFLVDDAEFNSIEELVDPEFLQRIRNTFAKSTGVEVIVGSPLKGGALTSYKMYPFCMELCRSADFQGKCIATYMAALQETMKSESDNIEISSCHLGLLAFGAGIRVGGKMIGMIGGCMVAPEKNHISVDECRELCKQYSYNGDFDKLYASLGDFPVFSPEKLEDTLSLFKEMALAISEIAQRQRQLKVEELRRVVISRYFSPNIYDLIDQQKDLTYKGTATVLFSDIRNFTSKSEKMRPEEIVEMLNDYFERMVDIIFRNDGTLDKFIGDAILAVFGAPVPTENNAMNAVNTALQMLDALDALNKERAEQGKETIEIGIGVHTGEVVSGNIGSSKRIEYTVIGDTVNVASRLESLTKNYPESIVISEETYELVKDNVKVAGTDEILLKGKSSASRIYRIKRA